MCGAIQIREEQIIFFIKNLISHTFFGQTMLDPRKQKYVLLRYDL